MASGGEGQPIGKPRAVVKPKSRARRATKRRTPSEGPSLMGRIPVVVVVTNSQGGQVEMVLPEAEVLEG